ncbi:MAG: N-acetylmuramoyl-L-alanine amidase [Defluviitaleaceae bacterium]|nr:N-acetylmuramoyl-L-alanine amidase [Defluviitaleaceae bacterium]
MRKRVFIDAGHNPTGTFNTGAAANGITEQDVVFDVALEMGRLLEGDFDVKLSRPTKETVLGMNNVSAINARWQMANEWLADIFISIHVNAGSGTGFETFFFDAGPANTRSVQSNALSRAITDNFIKATGLRDRGVKPDTRTNLGAIGVLRQTTMPATLVELAFIDSPRANPDVGLLMHFRNEMAEALAKGVYAYFGMEMGDDDTTISPSTETTPNTESEPETPTRQVFNTIQEVPDWARPTIEKLVAAEALQGNGGGNLDLCKVMLRVFTVLDMMGVFNREYESGSYAGYTSNTADTTDDSTDQPTRLIPEPTRPPPITPQALTTSQPQTPIPRPHNQDEWSLTDFEMEALCKMVWAEARGEDDHGQRLVVHVILNRMADPTFPNKLLEVLFQRNAFSPVRDGAFNRATPDEGIRRNVLLALSEPDQARGATFFRTIKGADDVPEGKWSHERNLTRLLDYGKHRFYR